ncbi:helix-turn-helix domain-containing protein [Alicyclobacillus sp. SO9]|uniref:helix-turn-helix domain-containing protein n=1 Tax=Alicyclobacillus sp. SO9 TaxID=2665646 RepID=UPI0018E6DD21|nr:helix-turn-helix transcriptional regulator [Alicyclobacillus sp. SO9]QQE79630.1 helix-turn-helix transcriptional regulator [Alicyclobacillus sp. SO9]
MTPVYIKVEKVRQKKSVTKAHIARYCSKSAAWYQDISNGRRTLKVEALQKIAEALDVPVGLFLKMK